MSHKREGPRLGTAAPSGFGSAASRSHSGNSKPFLNEQLVIRLADGETEGADPRSVAFTALRAAGHYSQPILKIIRAKCLDCSGGQVGEARKCTAAGCPLWPYRMGTNPFRRGRTNAGSFAPKKPGNLPGNSERHPLLDEKVPDQFVEAAE
jgi:hypothetical protein